MASEFKFDLVSVSSGRLIEEDIDSLDAAKARAQELANELQTTIRVLEQRIVASVYPSERKTNKR